MMGDRAGDRQRMFGSMPSLETFSPNISTRGLYHTRAYDRLTAHLWKSGSPRHRAEMFKLLTAIHQICAFGYLTGGFPPNKTAVKKLGARLFGECERTIENKFLKPLILDDHLLATITDGNSERVVLTEEGDRLVVEYLRLLHYHHLEMTLVNQYTDVFESAEQRLEYKKRYEAAVKMQPERLLQSVIEGAQQEIGDE
jgi:hypothetical protein